MNKKIELYDFVRPRTEATGPLWTEKGSDSVWRVIEIQPNGQIVAQKQCYELEPKVVRRIVSTPDFFELVDDNDEFEV